MTAPPPPDRPDDAAGPRSPAQLAALYQELILDHYRRPRNKGALERPSASGAARNPLCGDEVEVTLALDYAHPHDIAEILGRQGVCIRAGHHCAQPLMKRLGVGATNRASFAVHTTKDEVDRLIEALGEVERIFG